MSNNFERFRTRSMQAYGLLFGSIFGYTTFGGVVHHADGSMPDRGLFFVWVIMAFIGSTLVVLKNNKIIDSAMKARIQIAELIVIALLLVITYSVPSYIGLVKSLLLLIVMTTYISFYVNLLYKGKLIPTA